MARPATGDVADRVGRIDAEVCEAADKVAPEVPTAIVFEVAGVTLLDVLTREIEAACRRRGISGKGDRDAGAGADAAAAACR